MKRSQSTAGIHLLFSVMMVFQASALGAETVAYQWPVHYPYQFDIQDGSYAWLVTADMCQKTTGLLFDWDEQAKVLTVNGARVYPAVPGEKPYASERERERVYGNYPVVRKLYEELGSWIRASDQYHDTIYDYTLRLNARCREYLSGELSETELRDYFRESLAEYPYSEIFSADQGLELSENGFTVYANRPQPGFTPYRRLYTDVEKAKPRPPVIGSKERADSMVR